MNKKFAAIVLAGGEGKRLGYKKPKVLISLGGKPLALHILEKIKDLGFGEIIVVVGYQGEEVKKALGPSFVYAQQDDPLGTADAVRAGLEKVSTRFPHILVINGDDSAFYRRTALRRLCGSHLKRNAKFTLLSLFHPHPPAVGFLRRDERGEIYGRIESTLGEGISTAEINCGAYCFETEWLKKNLPKIKLNQKGEYYLTDLIEIAYAGGTRINSVDLGDHGEWVGINTREDLLRAKILWRKRSQKPRPARD